MKVTVLGTHSAFSTGTFKESVEIKHIQDLIEKSNSNKKTSLEISELEKILSQHKERVYLPRFQSNFLLEFKTKGKIKDHLYRLVIDFGSDIRHSLANIGLKMGDIDGYYCSHPHADHIGGVEGIALSTIFNPYWNPQKTEWLRKPQADPTDKSLENILDRLFKKESLPNDCKPDLWGHREVLENLWEAARPGLDTLQGVKRVAVDTYFNPIPMVKDIEYEIADGKRVWRFYVPSDVIYQDCETGPRSGVHSHIDDIRKCEAEVKKKCYLYHYTEDPVVDPDEFKGILRIGDIHEY